MFNLTPGNLVSIDKKKGKGLFTTEPVVFYYYRQSDKICFFLDSNKPPNVKLISIRAINIQSAKILNAITGSEVIRKYETSALRVTGSQTIQLNGVYILDDSGYTHTNGQFRMIRETETVSAWSIVSTESANLRYGFSSAERSLPRDFASISPRPLPLPCSQYYKTWHTTDQPSNLSLPPKDEHMKVVGGIARNM